MVSQREQILVVPMTNLEDVKKNITETVNAKTDADGLVDVTSFTEDDEKNGQASSVKCDTTSCRYTLIIIILSLLR